MLGMAPTFRSCTRTVSGSALICRRCVRYDWYFGAHHCGAAIDGLPRPLGLCLGLLTGAFWSAALPHGNTLASLQLEVVTDPEVDSSGDSTDNDDGYGFESESGDDQGSAAAVRKPLLQPA